MNRRQRYVLIGALVALLAACAYSTARYGDIQVGLENVWPYLTPIIALAGLLYLLPFKSAAKAKQEAFQREAAAIEADNEKVLAEGLERLMDQAQNLADRLYVAYPAPPPAEPLPGKTVEPKLAAMLEDSRQLLICQAKLAAFLVGYSFGMVRLKRAGPIKGVEAAAFDALFRLYREASFKRTMVLVNAVEDALAKGTSHMSGDVKFERAHAGRKAQELVAKADQRRIQYEVDLNYVSLVTPYSQAFPKGMMEDALRTSVDTISAHLKEKRLSGERAFLDTMASHGLELPQR